ncbi:MAG: hypothetical protein K2P81_15355 [Bacteriovoracaceae bacterium]|nr:hypothetical protein [Bacteriovoracaceae bacterium]
MFSKILSALLLSIWIAIPAQAQTFPNLIDYPTFVQLGPEDQKKILIALMQTAVEMEQQALEAGLYDNSKKTKTSQNEKIIQRFKEFQSALLSFKAYAGNQAVPKPPYSNLCGDIASSTGKSVEGLGQCLFGGWVSSYVKTKSNGRNTCQHPACSNDEAVRKSYVDAGGCAGNQIRCNPSIFGKNSSGKADCVNVTGTGGENLTHNTSLACLMEVEADPKKEDRLNKLIANIKADSTAANAFNHILHATLNFCVCGKDSVGPNQPKYQMSAEYTKYMQSHRTCYSLLNQVEIVTSRLTKENGHCSQAALPRNLRTISEDLSFIGDGAMSSRMSSLMDDALLDFKDKKDRERAIQFYRNKYITTQDEISNNNPNPAINLNQEARVVSASNALDKISSIEACLDKVKDGNAQSSCQQPKMTGNWCPLELPDPAKPTCKITGENHEKSSENNYKISAFLVVTDSKGSDVKIPDDLDITWVAGSATKTSKGKALSLDLKDYKDEKVTLTASVTIPGTTSGAQTCSLDIKLREPAQKTCTVTASNTPTPEKPTEETITAKIEFSGGAKLGDGEKIKWKIGSIDMESGESASASVAKQIDSDEVKIIATPPASTGVIPESCETTIKIDKAVAENKCELEGAISEADGKIKISSTPKIILNGKPIETEFSFKLENATDKTSAATLANGKSLSQEIPTLADGEYKLFAEALSNEAKVVQCDPVTITYKANVPPKKIDPKVETCTIAKNAAAPNEKGEYVVDIALQPKSDGVKDNKVQFGSPFTVDSKSPLAAHGKFKQTKEKQALKATAEYTDTKDVKFKCELSFEIPASAAATTAPPQTGPGPMQQMAPLPPPPDIFLQGIR